MSAPIRSLLVAACLTGVAAAAANDFSLPTWDEPEQKLLDESGWQAGVDLLVADPEEPAPGPLDTESPTADDFPAPPGGVAEIPQAALARYFGERPGSFLVDPQHLLAADASRDLLTILDSHAGDSAIDLFIYVFAKDQEIPGEVREEELIERCFMKGRPALVVYYFLGQPQQSVMHLSPAVTDAISAAEQRRALASSIMQGLEKSDPREQLQEFVVQMGIRICGMESLLGAGTTATADTLPAVSHPHAAKTKKESFALLALLAQRVQPAIAYWPQCGMAAGALLVGLCLWLWWRWRATYRLPEFEIEPRLGGDHAAGIGAVISFASPTLPPASQRSQIPDYLRRS